MFIIDNKLAFYIMVKSKKKKKRVNILKEIKKTNYIKY